jgi:hypothetical protein
MSSSVMESGGNVGPAMTPPVLPGAGRPPSVLSRGWLWLLIVAAVVFLFVLHRFPPGQYPIYPTCGLYHWTSLLCPGCGSLRALHHLTHGELGAALQRNALVILALPAAALGALALRFPSAMALLRPHFKWMGWVVGGAVVLFGILRNIPVEPFSWLAP